MKSILLIILSIILSLTSAAQVDHKSIFQQAVEARLAGNVAKLTALKEENANRPELSQLILREEALLFDRFNVLDRVDTEFTKKMSVCYELQEVQKMVVQSDYITGMKKLDAVLEDAHLLSPFERAYGVALRGLLFSGLNNYNQARVHLKKAQTQFDMIDSEVGEYWTKYVQFSVNLKYHRWKLANQIVDKIDKSSLSKYPAIAANFSTGESSIHFMHDRWDSVIPCLKNSLRLYQQIGDSCNIMKGYMNMGLYETHLGDMDTALMYFKNAKAIGKWFTQIRQETRAAISLYGVLEQKPAYRSRLLNVFGFSKLEGFESYIENMLYQVEDQDLSLHYLYQKSSRYENLGDTEKLVEALKLERDLLYELIVTDTSSVELVQYMLDLEKAKTEQLKLDNAKIKQNQKIQALELNRNKRERQILIISFLILFVGVLVFFLVRKNISKLRSEKRRMKHSLNQKEQELFALQQGISSKAKAIKELQEQLTLSDEEQSEHLESLKTMKILTDQDWDKFRSTFVVLYPNYQESLANYQIELTSGEERLLMMMRLKLSKNEISEMLGVGKESVRKSHYRLRKKIEPMELETLLNEITVSSQKL